MLFTKSLVERCFGTCTLSAFLERLERRSELVRVILSGSFAQCSFTRASTMSPSTFSAFFFFEGLSASVFSVFQAGSPTVSLNGLACYIVPLECGTILLLGLPDIMVFVSLVCPDVLHRIIRSNFVTNMW